jgi:hypothetical protein
VPAWRQTGLRDFVARKPLIPFPTKSTPTYYAPHFCHSGIGKQQATEKKSDFWIVSQRFLFILIKTKA